MSDIIENKENAKENPSSKKHKAGIIAGVVVAIVVVAGVGFFVWHEQPSFCDAICHTPMDGYLDTLEATPGEPAVDKWGNEVSDASAMPASVHGQDGKVCLDCHTPVLEEQVTEGLHWITGDYTAPLQERTLDDLVAARDGVASTEFCLNESCHDLTLDELEEKTSDMEFNPHVDQHGELVCSDCHKAHRASVMMCTACHDDAEVPEGWLSYEENVEQGGYFETPEWIAAQP